MMRWLPIPGCSPYEVSDVGLIRNGVTLRMPKPRLKRGYVLVKVCRRYQPVHRMVLLAFRGEPPSGMESRHLNGNRQDNRIENLEWSTHQVNLADKEAHGTISRGESAGGAKLTEAQAREIISSPASTRDLAAQFGIGVEQVRNVLSGVSWRGLKDLPRVPKARLRATGARNGSAKFTADDAEAIRASTRPVKELAAEYGVSLGAIYHIRQGLTWRSPEGQS